MGNKTDKGLAEKRLTTFQPLSLVASRLLSLALSPLTWYQFALILWCRATIGCHPVRHLSKSGSHSERRGNFALVWLVWLCALCECMYFSVYCSMLWVTDCCQCMTKFYILTDIWINLLVYINTYVFIHMLCQTLNERTIYYSTQTYILIIILIIVCVYWFVLVSIIF